MKCAVRSSGITCSVVSRVPWHHNVPLPCTKNRRQELTPSICALIQTHHRVSKATRLKPAEHQLEYVVITISTAQSLQTTAMNMRTNTTISSLLISADMCSTTRKINHFCYNKMRIHHTFILLVISADQSTRVIYFIAYAVAKCNDSKKSNQCTRREVHLTPKI